MTKEDLINAGYTRYDPPRFKDCVTDIFQKCIKDDIGKRYFITVERWDYSGISAQGAAISPHFQWWNQMTYKSNGETVEIECFHGWSIEDAEKFYADLWRTGWFKYYERYDYADDEEEEETEEKTSDAE